MESLLLVLVSTALALLLGWAIRRRLAFVTEVTSVSMAPTLVSGQWLLARRPRPACPLHRGDILVADSVELGRPIIKRVVGLPGEHIDIAADGQVRVGGHDLAEPYVVHRGGRPATFDVPAGHLLLLGDNRAGSSDARLWQQPYVPARAVLGRVRRHGSPTVANRGLASPGPPRH